MDPWVGASGAAILEVPWAHWIQLRRAIILPLVARDRRQRVITEFEGEADDPSADVSVETTEVDSTPPSQPQVSTSGASEEPNSTAERLEEESSEDWEAQ